MGYTAIRLGHPNHQVAFYHIPNRPLGSVPVMTLGSLAVVAIGPLNVVSGAGTVGIVQVSNRSVELFVLKCAEGFA